MHLYGRWFPALHCPGVQRRSLIVGGGCVIGVGVVDPIGRIPRKIRGPDVYMQAISEIDDYVHVLVEGA